MNQQCVYVVHACFFPRGKKFEENCRKSQAAMDDILPGLIIEGVLGVDLNDTGEFKGQLDDIMFYNSPSAQKIKNKEVRYNDC